MATNLKNLSDYDIKSVPNAEDMIFGIVTAEWNKEITDSLLNGAYKTLIKHGAKPENILKKYVPGTVELTLGAQFMAEYADLDAIICLGCVIQGETRHFDFVCHSVTHGITELNMNYNIPFIFGVLTTDNQQQAIDRAGGKHGNKGDEAAITAIKMAQLQLDMEDMEE
jgi:6,7-dimethyl-8-ribityllumazine synthase